MGKPFKTPSIVLDLSGRRFSTISMGSDAASTVREEHSQLLAVAAAVCGCSVETLTREMVASLDLSALRERLHGPATQS